VSDTPPSVGGAIPARATPSRVTSSSPIIESLPESREALANKYTRHIPTPTSPSQQLLSQQWQQATPGARQALVNLDTAKVERGSRPYAGTQSAYGLAAASTGETAIPHRGGLIENAINDISLITRSIPRLPFAVYDEIRELPTLPDKLEQAIATGSNPIEDIGNIAWDVPGLRWAPGSFVAGQFRTGGPGVQGLHANPVMAALDVAPFANKALKSTRTYQAADNIARLNSELAGKAYKRPPAIRTNLTRTAGDPVPMVDRFGFENPAGLQDLPRNAIGRATGPMMDRFQATRPGQWRQRVFGAESRDAIATTNLTHSQQVFAPIQAATAQLTGRPVRPGAFPDEVSRVMAEEFVKVDELAANTAIAPERVAEITRAIQANPDTAAFRATLTADELAYVDAIDQSNSRITRTLINIADDSPDAHMALREVEFPHGTEILPLKVARKVTQAQAAVDLQRNASIRQDVLSQLDSPTPPTKEALATAYGLDADNFAPSIVKRLGRDGGNHPQTRALLYQDLAILDQLGYDVNWSTFHKTNTAPKLRTFINDQLAAWQTQANRGTLGQKPPPATSIAAARDWASAAAKTDSWARALQQALSTKVIDPRRAVTALRAIESRKKFTPPFDVAQTIAAVKSTAIARRAITAGDRVGLTAKQAKKAAKDLESRQVAALPARWDEMVRAKADDSIRDLIDKKQAAGELSWEQTQTLIDLASRRLYAAFPEFMEKEITRLQADARRSWMELAANNMAPRYVHRVSPKRAAQMADSRPLNYIPSVSQAKARLWDPSPTVDDVAVSVQHRAYEILMRRAMDETYTALTSTYGRTYSDLVKRYSAIAEKAYAANPKLSFDEHLTSLIRKEWSPMSAAEYTGAKTPSPSSPRSITSDLEGTTTMVPKHIVDNIEAIRPRDPNAIQTITDPLMRTFRTSLLPLSPRWHLYNIFGGAIMAAMKFENPIAALKFAKDAARMASANSDLNASWVKRLGDEATRTMGDYNMPLSQGRRHAEFAERTGLSKRPHRAQMEVATAVTRNVAAGGTLRKLWDQMQPVRDKANNAIETSYAFNTWFDDFYRSLAMMYGESTALKRGSTAAAAADEGLQLASDVLMRWDRLTPGERSVLRSVFPFYSWIGHLVKYVSKYPASHPIRTQVLSAIARTEQQDFGTGLPQRLYSLLFMGDTDGEGKVRAVNLDGFNPFRDVANYATLVGFIAGGQDTGGSLAAITANANPIIGWSLQMVGVDPSRAAPDLYQDLEYDPVTGGLKVRNDSASTPWMAALNNIIPQTRTIGMLVNQSDDFKRLYASNPDAAARQLASAWGLPVVTRKIAVGEEIIKAEAIRYNAQTAAWNDAKRTGDLSSSGPAGAYPNLDSYRRQMQIVRDTQPQLIEEMTPEAPVSPNAWELVKGAINQK